MMALASIRRFGLMIIIACVIVIICMEKWQRRNMRRSSSTHEYQINSLIKIGTVSTESSRDLGRSNVTSTNSNGVSLIIEPHERGECLDLREFKMPSNVVRVSLHNFMKHGKGRPFLAFFHFIPTTFRPGEILTNSIHAEALSFNRVKGIDECKAIAIHNYKCGGTALASSKIKGMNVKMSNNFKNDRQKYIERIASVERSQHYNNNMSASVNTYPVRVFSFVRDPIDRFVSAVRQVFSLYKCRACRKCIMVRRKNHQKKEEAEILAMQCLFDIMEAKLSYLDKHLTPQVFTLYYAQQGFDIELDLMDMSMLNSVLDGLGRNRSVVAQERQNQNVGLVRGFNFTAGASLLSDSLIRRICYMYHVDVLLLEETGLAATRCSNPLYRASEPWVPTLPSPT